MLRVSWAYTLRKEELTAYLTEFGINPSGNVEDLRKRMAQFIGGEHDPDRISRLLELQAIHDTSSSGSSCPSVSPAKIPKLVISSESSPVKMEQRTASPPKIMMKDTQRLDVIETTRKWNLRYDGGRDPLLFIELLEEKAEMYNINKNYLPCAMPEILTERALMWFRNNNKHWNTWNTFKTDFFRFFLPARYFEKLEDEIRRRCQRPRELFKDYVLALQNLMRHSDMNESEKLERIFRNAHPDYLYYIHRKDFKNLSELLILADDFESIPKGTNLPNRNEPHRMLANPTLEILDENDHQNNFIDFSYSNEENTRNKIFADSSKNGHPKYPTFEFTNLWCDDYRLSSNIKIGDKIVTATIDTGATSNYISDELSSTLLADFPKIPQEIEVTLADGSRTHVRDGIECPVKIGPDEKKIIFLVMPSATEDMIIGLNSLRLLRTTITFGNISLRLDSTVATTPAKCMVTQESNTSADVRIVSSENVSTPNPINNKKTTINCSSEEQSKICRFLVEELSKFKEKMQTPNLSSPTTAKSCDGSTLPSEPPTPRIPSFVTQFSTPSSKEQISENQLSETTRSFEEMSLSANGDKEQSRPTTVIPEQQHTAADVFLQNPVVTISESEINPDVVNLPEEISDSNSVRSDGTQRWVEDQNNEPFNNMEIIAPNIPPSVVAQLLQMVNASQPVAHRRPTINMLFNIMEGRYRVILRPSRSIRIKRLGPAKK